MQQAHRRRMSKRVGRYGFFLQRGTRETRDFGVARHESLKGIGTEMTAARTGEDRITWFAWLIQQPSFQDGNDIRSQRRASHLSAFAKATNVGACAEHHILTPERGQFAVAQTRLNRYEKQCSVAVADPCSYVRRLYQSGGLALSKKLNRAVFAAFRWNC